MDQSTVISFHKCSQESKNLNKGHIVIVGNKPKPKHVKYWASQQEKYRGTMLVWPTEKTK